MEGKSLTEMNCGHSKGEWRGDVNVKPDKAHCGQIFNWHETSEISWVPDVDLEHAHIYLFLVGVDQTVFPGLI